MGRGLLTMGYFDNRFSNKYEKKILKIEFFLQICCSNYRLMVIFFLLDHQSHQNIMYITTVSI
jgi:hypothetical protein